MSSWYDQGEVALVLSRVPFAQNSTFATSPEVVTPHGSSPESVWPAVMVLDTSWAGVAVVVVVGVVVVVVVVVVGVVVVVVVVGVVVVVDVVVHRFAWLVGLQEALVLPPAKATPPANKPNTVRPTTTCLSAARSESCVFFMAANPSIGRDPGPRHPLHEGCPMAVLGRRRPLNGRLGLASTS